MSTGRGLVLAISSLPLFGLLSCVILSILKDLEASTATHCHVRNLLPSISAAIGEFSPQIHIWRFCIAVHSGPRLLSPLVIHNHFLRYHLPSLTFRPFVILSCVIHLIEILSLIMLSFVPSTDNYSVHKCSFILFITSSIVSMILQLVLRRWIWEWKTLPWPYSYYFRHQISLFLVYLFCLLLTGYFFLRHNTRCEPYVYSLFALCEYLTVVLNIVVNCHLALDFVGRRDAVVHKGRPV